MNNMEYKSLLTSIATESPKSEKKPFVHAIRAKKAGFGSDRLGWRLPRRLRLFRCYCLDIKLFPISYCQFRVANVEKPLKVSVLNVNISCFSACYRHFG